MREIQSKEIQRTSDDRDEIPIEEVVTDSEDDEEEEDTSEAQHELPKLKRHNANDTEAENRNQG